jgi:hypothetical protein
MPQAGFESSISASEQPQTHALDRAATAIGYSLSSDLNFVQGLGNERNLAS